MFPAQGLFPYHFLSTRLVLCKTHMEWSACVLLQYRWWWTFLRNGATGPPSARPHLHPNHPTLHTQLCLLRRLRPARRVQPRWVKGYKGPTAPGQRGLWAGLRLTWLQGRWPHLLQLHRIVQQLPSRQKHQVSLKATLQLYFATKLAVISLHQAEQATW